MSEYHGKLLKTTVSTLKRSENLCWRSSELIGLRPMLCRLCINNVQEKPPKQKENQLTIRTK